MATLALGLATLAQACGSTTPGSAGSTTSTTPPTAKVALRLDLARATATAGTQIHATLVLDNLTGAPIRSDCGFNYAVGLSNATIRFRAIFPDVCRLGQTIPAGLTRYPVTILTTYGSCSQSGTADGDTPGCLPGPMGAGSRFTVPPPLPAGAWRTTVVVNGIAQQDVRLPTPITVTLF